MKRRVRDLNSRGSGPRDFQSRALPGYANSAAGDRTNLLRLTATEYHRFLLVRIDYSDMSGRAVYATVA